MKRVRFAPSPTGSLHVGNALSAVANRRLGDWMLLRIDDTDPARNVPGGEEEILRDLRWLGLEWDKGPVRQSERQERYREAAGPLGARFGGTTLLREDGSATYQLASVVDDVDFGITHVVRGNDHRPNEPLQRRLFEARGFADLVLNAPEDVAVPAAKESLGRFLELARDGLDAKGIVRELKAVGGDLRSLRLALTGKERGPELWAVIAALQLELDDLHEPAPVREVGQLVGHRLRLHEPVQVRVLERDRGLGREPVRELLRLLREAAGRRVERERALVGGAGQMDDERVGALGPATAHRELARSLDEPSADGARRLDRDAEDYRQERLRVVG